MRVHTRPVLALVCALIACTLTLVAADPLTFTVCDDGGVGAFTPVTLAQPATELVPGAQLSLPFTGKLASTVAEGVLQMRMWDEKEGAQSKATYQTLERLSERMLNLPVAAGNEAAVSFLPWTIPEDIFSGSKSLVVELRAYAAQPTGEIPLMCVQVTVPLAKVKASSNKALGYGCALVAVICFGTNYLPVKAFDTGDGMFFQWVMCLGIWMVGLLVQLIRGSVFEPFAMVGGLMWCFGNILTVPIINCIGLGIGMVLWGGVGLIVGWLCGRFGILGVDQQPVANAAMNWIGILLCVASLGIMFTVKTVKQEQDALRGSGVDDQMRSLIVDDFNISEAGLLETNPAVVALQPSLNGVMVAPSGEVAAPPQPTFFDKLSPGTRRVLGISLAIVAGCNFGLNFNPPTYLMDSGKGASSHGIDYVFSHFTGILATSTLAVVVYCIHSRNRPQASPQIILPAMVSGVLWAIAQLCWFIANDQIGFVGTFPLISTTPGIVATLCAIIFYKEIQGRKNFLTLALAAVVTFTGVILIAFSLPKDD